MESSSHQRPAAHDDDDARPVAPQTSETSAPTPDVHVAEEQAPPNPSTRAQNPVWQRVELAGRVYYAVCRQLALLLNRD